jgi:hypothetical protein|nr:MAG TPA: hypothetical protein [Caudoviricetes sp.]
MAMEDPNRINVNHITERVNASNTHVMKNEVRAANSRQKQFEYYEQRNQTASEPTLYNSEVSSTEINNKKLKGNNTYKNSNFSIPESASEMRSNKRSVDLMKSAENELTKAANAPVKPKDIADKISTTKAGGGFKKFGYKALGVATLGAVAIGTINGIMNAGGRKTNAQLYSDPYA